MTVKKHYEDIPEINKSCSLWRCGKRLRIYAAISKELNKRVLCSTSECGLQPYVFKVGSTNNCLDRLGSLCEDRKPFRQDEADYFKAPRYAGVDDWKILQCWRVDARRYDDTAFKPWLAQNFVARHVVNVRAYYPVGVPGIIPGKYFKDLFIMSEDYVRARCPALHNDPMHEELLAVAADAIVSLVDHYHASQAA